MVGRVAAAIVGSQIKVYRCSEPSCLEKNAGTSSHCKRCGREIRGIIKNRNDRLDEQT
ncbi:MAG: hypothetical protein JXR83_07890 [Deltaproteobacteria bacterium]|nr:hypothetical protein [Deltaproteobacteria bacterium]